MSARMLISLDAMGGDNAPQMVVDGVDIALKRFPDARFLLFGDEQRIAPLLSARPAAAAAAAALAGPGGQAMLASPGGEMAPSDGEGMINIDQIEGQMRASSIRSVAELAEKHPDRALGVIRSWMAQES